MPKSVRSTARELALALLVLSISVGVGAAQSAANGVLGVFFDANGSQCEAKLTPAGITTLYVLLAAGGDTRGGIKGAEFRVDISESGARALGEAILLPVPVSDGGTALGGGMTVAAKECQSGIVIPILRFQIQNPSGGDNGVIAISARSSPTNPNFPCPLVNLCDAPAYTKVCVRPGVAVLNPTGSIACGSGAASSEWGRVKELYR